jgi:hypothetical protein
MGTVPFATRTSQWFKLTALRADRWLKLTSPRRQRQGPSDGSTGRLQDQGGWWPKPDAPSGALLYGILAGLIVWALIDEAPSMVLWTYAHTLLWVYVHILSHIDVYVRISWR